MYKVAILARSSARHADGESATISDQRGISTPVVCILPKDEKRVRLPYPAQMKTDFTTIDEYIASFPPEVQKILEKIRSTIQKAAPEATEAIRYQMPTFRLRGNLVHFAAYKQHIGFYPSPSAILAFATELRGYNTSKGAIQFPLDKPIPYDLITNIVVFRVTQSQDAVK